MTIRRMSANVFIVYCVVVVAFQATLVNGTPVSILILLIVLLRGVISFAVRIVCFCTVSSDDRCVNGTQECGENEGRVGRCFVGTDKGSVVVYQCRS